MTQSSNKPQNLRSQPTRDRILATARECFSQCGFEKTTIRTVAAGAGVAPAMVIRYYGNKEGLFAAAARIDLQLPRLDGVPLEGVGEVLVQHFLDRWEGARSDGQLQALLRAAISHTGAREELGQIFEKQLCAAIDRAGVDQPSTRAALVASQMLGLALGRYILELEPLATMSPDTITLLFAPTIQRYLSFELPAELTQNAVFHRDD
ncbi:TetR family transcriptional regulator [uncultured Agrobacterium sp.]|uniref:TetR/AcrR family transcriptional regulator n=1 Tax=uncultured Agrobacterium sp. TaxID=157277 RepID=UPI0025DE9B04|nr:TetR family transcriptional regulator [uncultured Agrobacterium sp.]